MKKSDKNLKKSLNDLLQDKNIRCSLFIHNDQDDNSNVIVVFTGFDDKDECLQFVENYKQDHDNYHEIDQEKYGTKFTIH
tara:strand:+ start:677 stop:916 length:240 start_codon:yes stop_codon:yes gene_type:complete